MSRFHTLEEGVGIAFDSIRTNKIRSGLTILGVSIGVGVIVVIAALVSGIRSSVMDGFESAGPDNFGVMRFDFSGVRISIESGRPPWWNRPRVEPEEAVRLARLPLVKEALYNYSFETAMSVDARFVAGRDFTPQEVRQSRPLVVISAPLAKEFFGERDPVGRRIRVTAGSRAVREAFTVVGVFENEENVFSAVIKHWAIFPYSAAMKRLKASNWQASVWIVPQDSVSQLAAMDQVIGAMRSMRGLRPREESDFSILRSAQILDIFNRLTGVFFLVMLALSSVGLLVGGIGVVGIMMISVTERTREIGIRKAVGATRQEILWQFLVEASVLTVLGGAAGLALGGVLSKIVSMYTPIPAAIPLWAILTALLSAAVTGMVFGIVPAYRASRLEPVHALRFE